MVDALGFLTVNDLTYHLRTLRSLEGLEPAEVAGTVAAISSPRAVPSGSAQLYQRRAGASGAAGP